MEQFIVGVMEDFGYPGMALLIAVENLFPPIPSEVILTFGGFSPPAPRWMCGGWWPGPPWGRWRGRWPSTAWAGPWAVSG